MNTQENATINRQDRKEGDQVPGICLPHDLTTVHTEARIVRGPLRGFISISVTTKPH